MNGVLEKPCEAGDFEAYKKLVGKRVMIKTKEHKIIQGDVKDAKKSKSGIRISVNGSTIYIDDIKDMITEE